MNSIKYILFFILILFTNCEPLTEPVGTSNAMAVLRANNYPLSQPKVLRENLLSERSTASIDSNALASLQWTPSNVYHAKHGYYLMGKTVQGQRVSWILLLEDSPSYSKAWLMSYNKEGILIAKKLVYHQLLENKPIRHSYLNSWRLEVNSNGQKEIFELSESGAFINTNLPPS